MPVDVARQVNDQEAAVMFGPVEPVSRVQDRDIPGPAGWIQTRIYRPRSAALLPGLVFFHGGGWVVGSLDSHDGVARFLANHGRCVVISVDYRLAPEHKFPAAVFDAWAATSWAHQHATYVGVDPDWLAVGGDSSGANLAAVVARWARDARLALALQLLVYPAVDCSLTPADEDGRWWIEQYLRTPDDALDADASPIRADDLSGVAPAFIQSCGLDPLTVQGEAYAERLRESGVNAEHIRYEGLIHGAYRMPAVLPGGRNMLEDSAMALIKAFSPAA